MSERRAVILDGARAGEEDLAPLLAILVDETSRCGMEVRTFKLREIRLGHCTGCFGCWVKTPGVCVEADLGRDIAEAVIRSDMTVLFTPATFGGYSSELKKIVDRWIPLLLPYFTSDHGETHHAARYKRYPRLVGIGVQQRPDDSEADIFKLIVGRNAINFHAPTHAADVVWAGDDPDTLGRRFRAVLARTDPKPFGRTIASRMPVPDASPPRTEAEGTGRVLLLVGSPKVRDASTSGVLGGYVLRQLEERGWRSESLTLKANLRQEKGQAELCSAVDRANLILLAFPLYIDALPALVTKAMEVIARHRHAGHGGQPKGLFALCNNGFPEAAQNTLALTVCHRLATEAGLTWSGGMAMGAGEALSSGQPLTATDRRGRPPVQHVIRALNLAGAALADGRGVPAEAVALIAKKPIPLMPFGLWRWIFKKGGARMWQQRASENGVAREQMLDRPYAE